ncbi:methyltransferase domain-containing protein [Candidatus Pelagibacter sp.]|uniref:class I SAM-dependent methyltransferase n=1 Tax=Candidatus Pelagibacter sp. TaxID=2024849 RepID=UPI003F83445E
MNILNCRNCNNNKFHKLFSLGILSYTGIFKNEESIIPKDELKLIMCKKCNLVQLSKNFNPKIMYDTNYGYRTGINNTMTDHVKSVVKKMIQKTQIKKNELALDIASNDGTLLNFYPKNIIKCGVDPILNKYIQNYKNIEFKINNFFEYKYFKKRKIKKKFKVITALSVFYDLKKPNKFLSDIKKLLDKNGVFFLEFADLISIIKYKMFDTICHEHLEYYSFDVIDQMAKKNNLKIIDASHNNINGGSIGIYLSHQNSKFKINKKSIEKIKKIEKNLNLKSPITFRKFFSEIHLIKKELKELILKIKTSKKIIHGYGASTKGNVLLQFFNINKNDIDCIADRNPKKDGLFTPGTKIKIVNEEISRKKKPNYYLVLPWHFKKEILKREKKIISKGTKFIFPLPKVKIS